MGSYNGMPDRVVTSAHEAWRAFAMQRVGVAPLNWMDFSEDYQSGAGLGGALSGAGDWVMIGSQAPGESHARTGAGVGGCILRPATTPYVCKNVRLKKWMIAFRVRVQGAVDATTQLFTGLACATTTTSRVGFGIDGAHGTTKMVGGLFAGALPVTAVSASVADSTKAIPNVNADVRDYITVYVANDAANIVFSADGETEVAACASTAVPSEAAYLIYELANGITGNTVDHRWIQDWIYFGSER